MHRYPQSVHQSRPGEARLPGILLRTGMGGSEDIFPELQPIPSFISSPLTASILVFSYIFIL
jgi:hypothetical protein